MGCKGSKAGDEAVDHSQKQVPQSWGELQERDPGAVNAANASAEEEEMAQDRGDVKMDSTLIRNLLSMMGANKEQMTFFEVWAKHVHDMAVEEVEGQGMQNIFISTDLRYLEARVTGRSSLMRGLLKNFVDKVKDMPKNSIDELNMVLSSLQESMQGTPMLTVWCKFKHCRSDAPPPSVDCGYLINQDLQWAVIDVMMPSHEDQDALREYALGEKHVPVLYSSSILPIAPEKSLGFELLETAAANSRQILLTAFFFFKALGLMKPEDRIVRILNSCESEQLVVCAGIGPEGLVRLALSLIGPKNKQVAKELADELAFTYRERDLIEICDMMGGEPDIIDYVGETKGYGIRLGFTV